MKIDISKFFLAAFLLWFGLPAHAETYQIPNSPFTMRKEAYTVMVGSGRDASYTTKYQYYLEFYPNSEHAHIPRVEYVGFKITYDNSGVRYFQIFPDGYAQELTDPSQVLYIPSRVAMQPSQIQTYQLFSAPVEPGGCVSANELFNINVSKISEICFMAGYGFLTSENQELIDRQQRAQARAEQLNIPFLPLDRQTMELSLAQGNMLQNNIYYTVLNMAFSCVKYER